MSDRTLPIVDDVEHSRILAVIEDETCVLNYHRDDDNVVVIDRVYVPSSLEGRGIAAALTRHALETIRSQGRRVYPRCPYVATYIERHPNYRDLVADE